MYNIDPALCTELQWRFYVSGSYLQESRTGLFMVLMTACLGQISLMKKSLLGLARTSWHIIVKVCIYSFTSVRFSQRLVILYY